LSSGGKLIKQGIRFEILTRYGTREAPRNAAQLVSVQQIIEADNPRCNKQHLQFEIKIQIGKFRKRRGEKPPEIQIMTRSAGRWRASSRNSNQLSISKG